MTEEALPEDVARRYRELRNRRSGRQQELAAVRGQATSPDGRVTARTGPRGEVLDLHLDQTVYLHPDATALARTITETIAAAAQDAAAQTSAVNQRHAAPSPFRSVLSTGLKE